MGTKTIRIKNPSVLMSVEEYENIQETIEILSDSKLVRAISSALNEPEAKRKSHQDVFTSRIKENGRSKIQ